ncbi:MAG: choloylglycine hydrolase family protein [Candidatus Saganbacteria bacterium]|nr:choloylglycine hydrolase family protein [Candidatus Saganbacteria bacterium]
MKKCSIILLVVLFFQSISFACSDFVVTAKDKSVVNGRSMEFPVDMKANIWLIPRGNKFTSITDKKVVGINWVNKYGFLAIDAFNVKDGFVDGLNEKGLSCSALAFGKVKYQEAVPGKFVTWKDFPGWVLGNFANVAEVKAALTKINIADCYVKKIKGNMGMHVAVHDEQGKNIVIEIVNDEIKVYDNPLGVMTNRPGFEWHMTNLSNYVNLDPNDKKSRKLEDFEIEPTGVGSGMIGLPGNWTPPSRFVRLAFSGANILKPKDSTEAVNAAEHLLNIVDIPRGVIKEQPFHFLPFIHIYGYAQWVVIKDMTNREMYYKTYENTAWKKVDLKKFDLSKTGKIKSIAMEDHKTSFIDVSGKLKP